MKVNPDIFKAYDIRGIYKKDFDEGTAYKLGLAYCKIRRKELGGKSDISIVVAEDMRLSSPESKKNLIRGLTDGCLNVVDIGLASTPTFYFAVAHYKYDGGILVSASHNPKEWNGFKLVRERAIPISKDSGMFELRDLVISDKTEVSDKKGRVEIKKNVLADQITHDLKYADISKIKPFRIVIDPANSMGILYFDELFKYLNCEIIRMNWKLDGTFPAHEADPLKFENMDSLLKKIKEEKADLGIATDGDGDRIFFADNDGQIVEPGIVRAILSKIFLKDYPGSKVAYDIRPGRITRDIILENGGIPIVTPVGHSLIKEQALKEGAYFSGESSGHFFLNMKEGCYEVPLIVTLRLLQEVSESGLTFSEYVKPYKKYFHSGEINSKVKDVAAKITEIKQKYTDGEQNDLDGISVEYTDWWFNVRGSNTEPVIRLNVEANTKELMEKKRDEILGIIRS
jgi:phosphomannomutase